uniref:ATP synthase F0 subunit 8 n=1 Tax=Cassiopea frondosa TaxID=237412 RepID=G9ISE7_CASFR|nr:ATP synthase F0 subunit 8 [Cassiopea xamachana]AER54473.1 ATP synthase F0 subunit 8 [Cassiopea xamachana]
MPQLDVVTFINQYVWLVGSMVLLIIILVSLVLPNTKKLMEARINISEENVSFLVNKEYRGLRKLIYNLNG